MHRAPVFENYYLCLGYVAMAVYCYLFGILGGVTTGFFGLIIYCFITNGLKGMPEWAFGNVVIGIVVGTTCIATKNVKNVIFRYTIMGISMAVSTAVDVLGAKSLVECTLYAKPFLLRTANNIYAFVADVFVMIFSLPICYKMNKVIKNQ